MRKTMQNIPMKNKLRITALGLGLVLAAALVALSIYGLSLSKQIETRFAGRRWQVPSRVFSSPMLLYPGQKIDRGLFIKKLERLNYRPVSTYPAQKGEMNVSGTRLLIYLHDTQLPGNMRKGFPVYIQFTDDPPAARPAVQIDAIQRIDNGESMSTLELEPEELALLFGPDRERRRLVSIRDIPDHFIKAFLAAEDAGFYDHYGISITGIARAFYKNLLAGEVLQGGSTITQQMAKNYFLKPDRTIKRKLKEIVIALIIELKYEKNDILEIYFNEIYFGQKGSSSINGAGEAANFYFGKSVSDLTLPESAMLAGLIKGPNIYSPYKNPKAAIGRRNHILDEMARHGWVPEEDLPALKDTVLSPAGFHTYSRRAPYFIDYLQQQLSTLYTKDDLSSLGLAIHTTLDTMVQAAASEALEKGLTRLERLTAPPSEAKETAPGGSTAPNAGAAPGRRLQGAVIVMQPRTGHILAMVGGRDYSRTQFNRVTQSHRQTGSLFKPFVCLAALDRFTPASVFSNEAKTYPTAEGLWEPKNYTPVMEMQVSMRTALAKSYNRAIVDLAMQTGIDNIIKTAADLNLSARLKPYPSLALGAFEAAPIEIARAYCAFAADGMLPFPLALKNVTGSDGKVLNRRRIRINRVMSPAKAFIISSMLRSAVEEGTARSLNTMGIHFPVAAKTGTSSNYRDAWFVGYTPDIQALVWVGYDQGGSIEASGALAALPIWAELMTSIPRYASGSWFRQPPGVVKKTICTESGLLSSRFGCPDVKEEVFLEDNAPDEVCPVHGIRLFDNLLKGLKKFAD